MMVRYFSTYVVLQVLFCVEKHVASYHPHMESLFAYEVRLDVSSFNQSSDLKIYCLLSH